MNNNILNLVKQFAGDSIVNNPDVPQEKNESAIQSVSQGIFDGLKQEATGGGLTDILNMFKSSGNVSNSLSENVQDSVISSLMEKIGIKNTTAQKIASSIVPMVLSSLSKMGKNSSGSNSGMNVQEILNSLTGGKTNGVDIQGFLDKNMGGNDGKFELSDLTNLFHKG